MSLSRLVSPASDSCCGFCQPVITSFPPGRRWNRAAVTGSVQVLRQVVSVLSVVVVGSGGGGGGGVWEDSGVFQELPIHAANKTQQYGNLEVEM